MECANSVCQSHSSSSSSDSQDNSSISEGDLNAVQGRQPIRGFVEVDADSFTSESSEDILDDISTQKSLNKSPSLVSFLILRNARIQNTKVKISSSQDIHKFDNTIKNIQSKSKFSCDYSEQKKRKNIVSKRSHTVKNKKNSLSTEFGAQFKNTSQKCYCCKQKVFNSQDVACFSICEHTIHEYCLMELIEINKYENGNLDKKARQVLFCPHCKKI